MQSNTLRKSGRNLLKRIAFPVLKWIHDGYRKKERTFTYKGLKVIVPPSVFHPGYLLSTKIFTNYLEKLEISGKDLLELGCGSGLLSLYAARLGAKVTASDINPAAVEGLKRSALANGFELTIFKSDLFQNFPSKSFDYIFINPPYYPKEPASAEEQAFYCGADYEYFRRLFQSLPAYLNVDAKTFMILSEDCDLARIKGIGKESGFDFVEVHKEKRMWEWNYIFDLQLI